MITNLIERTTLPMSGTIFVGDGGWPVSGWLFRWVITDLEEHAGLSPDGLAQLELARALQIFELGDLTAADRALVIEALGEPQSERFREGLRAGFDPATAIGTLRELHALVDGSAR